MPTSTIARRHAALLLCGSRAARRTTATAGIADPRSASAAACPRPPACTGGRGWRACAGRWRRTCSCCTTSRSSRCADGRVSHYEALLRLADEPDGALIAPGRFLPAAERYGLIREIDRMVLDKVIAAACGGARRAAACASRSTCSALSVTDGGMLAHIERELALARGRPRRLVIEVTETAAISDMARARAFCAGVQALGCAVALDDFGAGFGSFQYLKHLPFQLPEDRRRLHPRPARLAEGPARRQGARRASRAAWASRRSPSSSATSRRCELLRDYGVTTPRAFEVGPATRAWSCRSGAPVACCAAYFGWGNWLRIAASHTRSGSRRRCSDRQLGRGRDRDPRGRRGGADRLLDRLRDHVGPPPRWRIGPS